MDYEKRIADLLKADPWRMQALCAMRDANIGDAWIAAGFIRNLVWDSLTNQLPSPPNEDVDVLVFDANDLSWDLENLIEDKLKAVNAVIPWSVRNQARMHDRNNDAPYLNIEHAMAHWLETATSIGVRLSKVGDIEFISTYGYDDLFKLILRPTARGHEKVAELEKRAHSKGWLDRWRALNFLKDSPAKPYEVKYSP